MTDLALPEMTPRKCPGCGDTGNDAHKAPGVATPEDAWRGSAGCGDARSATQNDSAGKVGVSSGEERGDFSIQGEALSFPP